MKINRQKILVLAAAILFLFIANAPAQTPIYLDSTKSVDARVQDLLSRMTLDEKIGQMMQVDHTGIINSKQDIIKYYIGSILSGGDSDIGDNKTTTWANLYDTLQSYALRTPLKIPIIYGIDAVHGNNNIYGATIFPHNIGMGCTRDTELVKEEGRVTAEELAATGIDWAFAPCIADPRNIRWGRTYEGFGETPDLAGQLGAAEIEGMQGDTLAGQTSILACAKHFLGDGGTQNGQDQGNVVADETTVRKLFLPQYIDAIKAGVGSVMASYSSINGIKMHANKYWLTDVLKNELGFKGFIVSDWAAIDQLGSNYEQDVETSVNAGIDMVMLPMRYQDFYNAMIDLVNTGKITTARVDDAVSRILRIKFELGLFERPYADRSLVDSVGSYGHRQIARQAVRESLVLLKRKDGVLPIAKTNARILVAGDHADDIGNQCGGWTISWQGSSGNIIPGTTILQGMKQTAPNDEIDYSVTGDYANTKADYSVVIIGETPYAEGRGDRTDLSLNKSDIDLIKKMKSYGNPVVVILISGRPMIIEPILHYADAIIAAWLPGTEGEGVSDVLFGDYAPKGLLSHTWPKDMSQVPMNYGDSTYDPLFPYGYGITSFANSEKGSSPVLMSAIVTDDAKHIELTFNKAMKDPSTATMKFQIYKNDIPFDVNSAAALKSNDSTTIVLSIDSTFDSSDTVTISYTTGNIESADGGTLQPFSAFDVYNWAASQTSFNVPGKIEAEDYSDMYGVQTETTTDAGGGLDVGWIDDGDWMEYPINVSSSGQYILSLRVASLSQAGTVLLSEGNNNLGTINLPVTGGWQAWTTVKQNINLNNGVQTLRITAQKGGFNLNWFSFDNVSAVVNSNYSVSMKNHLDQNYPNPFNPTTELHFTISRAGLVSLKVYNLLGQEVKTLLDRYLTPGDYSVRFNGNNLTSGIYFYRLASDNFAFTKNMVLLK